MVSTKVDQRYGPRRKEKMERQELILFAIRKDCDHFEQQKSLAYKDIPEWQKYVSDVLIPAYRTRYNAPYEGMGLLDVEAVAMRLQDYYFREVTKKGTMKH